MSLSVACNTVVWPDSGQQQEQQRTGVSSSSQVSQSGPRSLGEQAVAVMVRHLVETTDGSDGDRDGDLFREAQNITNFPVLLRNQLHQHAHKLHQSPFAADLLRTAYAEQTHLDWVTFSHLSAEVIGSALRSDSLKHARSISLCIDQINGTPTELISALATHTPLFDSLYLHQTPTRQTDQPTADLLAHLTTHPQLARTPNLFLTGIFSASLRRTILLPPQTFTPHFPPFPIQHLFIRYTVVDTTDDDDDSNDGNNSDDPGPLNRTKIHWPEYYYLGDTPYRPERFATGFLRLLHALAQGRTAMHSPDNASDRLRDTLCGAPPTLRDDLFFSDENEPAASRVQIAPLPCENRSIPWLAVRCGVPREVLFRGECWPLVRAPDPEAGWSVVVDVVEEEPMVRYAFVKDVEGEEKVRVVGGPREFLGEAAPEVEGGLLDRRLEELERSLARWDARLAGLEARPVRLRWVHALGEGEAREMLDELLLDAKTFGRNMLKVAMLARPEGELS